MSYRHFSQSDRDEISILLKKGYSHRNIAEAIGKNHSSVSREINKNSRINGVYDPKWANLKAYKKRRNSKYQGMKISENNRLETETAQGLVSGWSPEEIAGRLKYLNRGRTVISAKSIYKFCYSSRGQYLSRYLPHQQYQPKKRTGCKIAKTMIPNRVFIDFRPKAVALRLRFGDFEGDTLGRPGHEPETLVGAVERKSLYFIGCKMPRLKYAMDGLNNILSAHRTIVKSLTLDNGVENASYKKLHIKTYFCHPYSAWEKPVIENTFGRLRRFIPKKSSLSRYSNDEISAIIESMNRTPRKKLGFRTPQEVFNELSIKSFNSQGVALEGKM